MSHMHTEPEGFASLSRDPETPPEGQIPGFDVNSALLFKARIMTTLVYSIQYILIFQKAHFDIHIFCPYCTRTVQRHV